MIIVIITLKGANLAFLNSHFVAPQMNCNVCAQVAIQLYENLVKHVLATWCKRKAQLLILTALK